MNTNHTQTIATTEQLKTAVLDAVDTQSITDIHTHLFSPPFGELLLWGIDELLTYHYLIAEVFRKSDVSYRAILGDDEDRTGRPHLADTFH